MSGQSGDVEELIKKQQERDRLAAEEAENAAKSENGNAAENKAAENEAAASGNEAGKENDNSEKVGEEKTEQKAPEKPKKTFKEILAEQEAEELARIEKEEIERLKDDPDFKAIKAARKRHPEMTLQQIVNMLAETSPNDLDDKAVYMNSLAGEKLTPEELEEEWEEFNGQKPFIKDRYLESERSKLSALQEQRRKEYGLDSKPSIDYSAQYTKAKVSLEATLEKVVGTEIDGVVITAERAGQLFQESQKFFGSASNSIGEVDVNDAFDTAFAKLCRTTWKKEIEEKAKSEGKSEAFYELHNPNAASMVASNKNQPKKVVYDEQVDKLMEELKSGQQNSYLIETKN
jgi:hypothetical protein